MPKEFKRLVKEIESSFGYNREKAKEYATNLTEKCLKYFKRI